MTKPNLYMLIGIPCSGKSTLINTIIQESDVILSTDNYIEAKANEQGLTYNDVFKDSIKEATENLEINLKEALAKNKTIFWDQTNISVASRFKKLKRPEFEYYNKFAIYFNVPIDICLKRNQTRIGKVIPITVMHSMHYNREYPTFEEGFDYILEVSQKP